MFLDAPCIRSIHSHCDQDKDKEKDCAAGSSPRGQSDSESDPLRCMVCNEPGTPMTLKFCHEWQGRCWCVCEGCWTPGEAKNTTFHKERKASWRQRSNSAKAALRGIQISKCLNAADREADESVRSWKRRMIAQTASFLAAFMSGFVKMDPDQQKDIVKAFDLWEAEKQRVSRGEAVSATSLRVCGNVLPDEAMQMASELMTGISEFFVCRNTKKVWDTAANKYADKGESCGYFAPAKYWACSDETFCGGHFRCGLCGVVYQPWKQGDRFAPYNKLLIVECNDAQSRAFWGKALGDRLVEVGSVQYIPFWWADSTEASLQNRLKEVMLRVGEELKDVPVSELPSKIAALALEREVKKSWWKTAPIHPDAVAIIDQSNASNTRERFHYDHMKAAYPWAKYDHDPMQEVWSAEKLAAAWGTLRLAIRAAQRDA